MDSKNLHQKLLDVKNKVDYLKKESQGKQYSYVGSSQVLGAIRDHMNEAGILLIPEIVETKVSRKEEKKALDTYGNEKSTITYFTELKMIMTWVDVDNVEDKIICRWYGQGVDIAGEKGVGKALTYAEKYFLLKFFNIPTDKDDPDSFQNKTDKQKKPAEKPKPKKEYDYKKLEDEINVCQKIKQLIPVGERLKIVNFVGNEGKELFKTYARRMTELTEKEAAAGPE